MVTPLREPRCTDHTVRYNQQLLQGVSVVDTVAELRPASTPPSSIASPPRNSVQPRTRMRQCGHDDCATTPFLRRRSHHRRDCVQPAGSFSAPQRTGGARRCRASSFGPEASPARLLQCPLGRGLHHVDGLRWAARQRHPASRRRCRRLGRRRRSQRGRRVRFKPSRVPAFGEHEISLPTRDGFQRIGRRTGRGDDPGRVGQSRRHRPIPARWR